MQLHDRRVLALLGELVDGNPHPADGFAGLYVTKPFKIEAAALADRLTPAAAAIGA